MAVIAEAATFSTQGHLRPLDIQRDLLPVADLIELCFASTMDPDGQQYLNQMRRAARDASFLRWAPGASEHAAMPISGFIWEEDGRLVGNLSLIPLIKGGKRVYFIANVAVHPNYRSRGIARALTATALETIRSRRSPTAWLQVRQDNPYALKLYQSEGFIERARRNTWQLMPGGSTEQPQKLRGVAVSKRIAGDWEKQKAWLNENYPPEVAWNLPFNANSLRPSLWVDFIRFITGESTNHWAAHRNGQLLGTLSFEPTPSSSDNLWLAAPLEKEEEAIFCLMPEARYDLAPHRTLTLNYPAGRAEEAFISAGFKLHQTLIWMEITLG